MSPQNLLYTTLRATLAPLAGPSTPRAFSSSQRSLVSTRKLVAKRRKAANLALQASRVRKPDSIDPVLGRVQYKGEAPTNPWEGCRLQRVLLDYNAIAYSMPPDYTAGEQPRYLLPGVSKEDAELLFNAVPHASTELRYASGQGSEKTEQEQARQSEMMMRILDLRNASKDAINVLNRQRVIDEFGAGVDSGSSAVQGNPRDTSNKRALRLLVQERARHLKYWKRKQGEEAYEKLLADLGLQREAVEGELFIGF
ncbi:30S small subunit ribosomal protein S15 [Cryptococcus deuterogattii 99/473]|uniref:30S small subunit ribosomal protein S15 n=1 Tax=Cryptococcus deuterogattii Ram5 TaxID=1296110 RepID=A0A0D0VFR6_9TREE|nr:30S small subunit ribosomal protein S15 [Cryptococcus deuterogattii LA55]KIR37206.1 30S small subunit ribosomal protein S15 [Cryptococcus deuterogattii MMRL2647]KIR43675.1 30S small subunit ribosomal protein S15 [Cryptococcus deuterogattii Ram5]KIR75009.1 30S small subunit ribosomal protein S15 [Cryptococcus deuterogattii CA1014]KIR92678.1 30S small subunit ribosomal protein S15 [Cryptococcus deuterogattii CBS 10090]KIR97999.1 30S small subunit ribosomal protein S15 [Cryptococcus deuterogat